MIRHKLLFIATLCFYLLVSSTSFAAEAPAKTSAPVFLSRKGSELLMDGKPYRAVGVNKFDLALQYIRGDDDTAKAAKAIEDTAAHGFGVVRLGLIGFYPKDMALWPTDEYWKRLDTMFAAVRRANLKIIPVIYWNAYLFPDMTGETLQYLITNKDSRSRQYLDYYIQQLVTRYKDEECILFWELWSELNLAADLEFIRPYGYLDLNITEMGTPPTRVRRDNYTTEQAIPFLRDMARMVRSIDPNHLISSGHSIQRHSAQHLRLAKGKGDWTLDNRKETEQYLKDTHPDPIDIISIHLYNFFDDNKRLGIKDKDSAAVLRDFKQMADHIGKPIFLGETGGQAFDDPTGDVPAFSQNVIKELVATDYPITTWWVSSQDDVLRFEPDKTPQLNKILHDAERMLKENVRAKGMKQ
ncbi:MAG: cellulase family glycosylhydrolase [Armatimonadota bacterium]